MTLLKKLQKTQKLLKKKQKNSLPVFFITWKSRSGNRAGFFYAYKNDFGLSNLLSCNDVNRVYLSTLFIPNLNRMMFTIIY